MSAYLTLGKQAETQFTVQKSRFIGFAAPAANAEDALALLDTIKKNSRDASHHCFAYIIGQNKGIQRYSDDGEPSGTAGKPIIEVMSAKGVVDCIVVVTRYFGGVLLGAGGLTRAYAHTASLAIEAAGISTMHETVRLDLAVGYPLWDKVQYGLQALPVIVEDTEYLDLVKVSLLCRVTDETHVQDELVRITDGKLTPKRNGDPLYYPWSI
ncbi:MAG TPA: YigZ family protein [Candidatus Limiplasma sp.]|nr:YigZ family protein [Candidatus Limiplasma sp.]HRX08790.1 YigZ family protein [Candidatus Limiplasma sp.]